MRWVTDIENFENITVEDAKFLFSQAEKKLDDTIKVSDTITARSYSIITVLVGILTAVSGVFLKSVLEKGINRSELILESVGVIYLIGCLLFLIWNVSATKYWTLGSEPQHLCRNKFFEDDLPKNLISVYLYINEIENYQERITVNLEKNRNRFLILRNVLVALYLLPFILATLYLFL